MEKNLPSGFRLGLVCSIESICFSSAVISLDLVTVILPDLWLFNVVEDSGVDYSIVPTSVFVGTLLLLSDNITLSTLRLV